MSMRWQTMETVAPEHAPLLLRSERGLSRGWCSRRFLGGRPTYWAWTGGRVRLVIPLSWRAVHPDAPNGGMSLAYGSFVAPSDSASAQPAGRRCDDQRFLAGSLRAAGFRNGSRAAQQEEEGR